jgi:hypothetical protein
MASALRDPLSQIGHSDGGGVWLHDTDRTVFQTPNISEQHRRNLHTTLTRTHGADVVSRYVGLASQAQAGKRRFEADRPSTTPQQVHAQVAPRDEHGRFRPEDSNRSPGGGGKRQRLNGSRAQRARTSNDQQPQQRSTASAPNNQPIGQGYVASVAARSNGARPPQAEERTRPGNGYAAAANTSVKTERNPDRGGAGGNDSRNPCKDCGNPLHSWENCPRNKDNPKCNEFAVKHAGEGKFYTGRMNGDGTPERITQRTSVRRVKPSDTLGRSDEIIVDCWIGHAPAAGAVIDTGAQRTLMSAAFHARNAATLGPIRRSSHSQHVLIEGISGIAEESLGTIRTRISFCDPVTNRNYDTPATLDILVAEHLTSDVLIGMDVLSGADGISAIDLVEGQLRYGEGMIATPLKPVPYETGNFPVRFLRTTPLRLNPGQKAPIHVEVGISDERLQACTILVGAIAVRTRAGKIMELGIPPSVHRLTRNRSTHRFMLTLHNEDDRPLLLMPRAEVARATIIPDDAVQACEVIDGPLEDQWARTPAERQIIVRRQHVTYSSKQFDVEQRSRWLQQQVNNLVTTIMEGAGDYGGNDGDEE